MTKSTVEKAEQYPKLKELIDFLNKNYWDEFVDLHEGQVAVGYDHDVLNELLLVRDSRLTRSPLHILHSAHGHDPNKLAEDILAWVKERLEEERNENVNYCNKLVQHVKEFFTDDVGVYAKDRKENSSIPGRRFRVAVELKADSNEHKRCGDWVFAEGYGRDQNQAAKAALEMLELKEKNDLLWLNEWYNHDQPNGAVISFFDSKKLESVKKQMLKNSIQVPNSRKDGEPIKLELKKSASSLSMKSLLTASPLTTPTKAKDSDLNSVTGTSSSLLSRLSRRSNNSSQNSSGSAKKSTQDTSHTDHSRSHHKKTADKAGKKAETRQRPSTGQSSQPGSHGRRLM